MDKKNKVIVFTNKTRNSKGEVNKDHTDLLFDIIKDEYPGCMLFVIDNHEDYVRIRETNILDLYDKIAVMGSDCLNIIMGVNKKNNDIYEKIQNKEKDEILKILADHFKVDGDKLEEKYKFFTNEYPRRLKYSKYTTDTKRVNGWLNNETKKHSKFDVITALNVMQAKESMIIFEIEMQKLIEDTQPTILKDNFEILHISKFEEDYNLKYKNEKELGLDIETSGFVRTDNLRFAGFSISSLTQSTYYYFSKDTETYNIELNKYKDILYNILDRDREKFWVYNSAFEDQVFRRILGIEIFFNDVFIYMKILKNRGSLKENAFLFLNTPLWTESIEDFGVFYKEINDILSPKKRKILYDRNTLNKDTLIEIINSKDSLKSYYESQKDNSFFNLDDLVNCLKENLSGWIACDSYSMGKYCCMDSFYTIHLRNKIYLNNYKHVNNGYKWYYKGHRLTSNMEYLGVYVDYDRFTRIYKEESDRLLEITKRFCRLPEIVHNYSLKMSEKNRNSTIKSNIRSNIEKYKCGRVTNSVVDLVYKITRYENLNRDDLYNKYFNILINNKKELQKIISESDKKLKSTDKNKILFKSMKDIEKSIYYLEELINKYIVIGYNELDKNDKKKIFYEACEDIYNKSSMIDDSYEVIKKEFLEWIDNCKSFDEMNNKLGFNSPLAETKKLFTSTLLDEDLYIRIVWVEIYKYLVSVMDKAKMDRLEKKYNESENFRLTTEMSFENSVRGLKKLFESYYTNVVIENTRNLNIEFIRELGFDDSEIDIIKSGSDEKYFEIESGEAYVKTDLKKLKEVWEIVELLPSNLNFKLDIKNKIIDAICKNDNLEKDKAIELLEKYSDVENHEWKMIRKYFYLCFDEESMEVVEKYYPNYMRNAFLSQAIKSIFKVISFMDGKTGKEDFIYKNNPRELENDLTSKGNFKHVTYHPGYKSFSANTLRYLSGIHILPSDTHPNTCYLSRPRVNEDGSLEDDKIFISGDYSKLITIISPL